MRVLESEHSLRMKCESINRVKDFWPRCWLRMALENVLFYSSLGRIKPIYNHTSVYGSNCKTSAIRIATNRTRLESEGSFT